MKKIFFIVLLSLTVFCFSSAKTTNNISIPKEVKYSGVLRDSITFTDSLGTHILITSELENTKERSSYIFAYDYLKKDKNSDYKLNWKLEDGTTDCEVDYFSTFAATPTITDLDKNGIKEVTMAYSQACTGDVSPSEYKVIMRENQNKYGLRGNTFDPITKGNPNSNPCCYVDDENFDFSNDPGKYQNENDFKKAPKVFLDYAKKIWVKYRDYGLDE